MSDTKPKRTLSEEQKTKMQAAAKASREKRAAEKAAGSGAHFVMPDGTRTSSFVIPVTFEDEKPAEKAAGNPDDKPKRTLSEEQKAKMQAAAKAAREKRDAEEKENPDLKTQRLAKAKEKRESKKTA